MSHPCPLWDHHSSAPRPLRGILLGFCYYDTEKSPPQPQNHGSSTAPGSRLGVPAVQPPLDEPQGSAPCLCSPCCLKKSGK